MTGDGVETTGDGVEMTGDGVETTGDGVEATGDGVKATGDGGEATVAQESSLGCVGDSTCVCLAPPMGITANYRRTSEAPLSE